MPLALIEEYGTYASERWVRTGIGLFDFTPEEVSEACRKLTRTMLSMRLVRPEDRVSEDDVLAARAGSTAHAYVDRLATTEDRSITWPEYPDPAPRKSRLRAEGRL
jgi:hypothetical protein